MDPWVDGFYKFERKAASTEMALQAIEAWRPRQYREESAVAIMATLRSASEAMEIYRLLLVVRNGIIAAHTHTHTHSLSLSPSLPFFGGAAYASIITL
jgi:hypothetical protein